MTRPRPGIGDLQRCFAFWMERKTILEMLFCGGYLDRLFLFAFRYTDFQVFGADGTHVITDEEARVFVIGGFLSLLISWQVNGYQRTPEEMARIGYKMFYEPFIKTK